jgi:hypothetical protein
MRIIHGSGFSEDERRNVVQVIYHNVCVAMQTMIRAMEKLQIQYDDTSNIVSNLGLIFITEATELIVLRKLFTVSEGFSSFECVP